MKVNEISIGYILLLEHVIYRIRMFSLFLRIIIVLFIVIVIRVIVIVTIIIIIIITITIIITSAIITIIIVIFIIINPWRKRSFSKTIFKTRRSLKTPVFRFTVDWKNGVSRKRWHTLIMAYTNYGIH